MDINITPGGLEAELRFYGAMVEMDEHLRRATGENMTSELLQAMSSMKIMLDSLKILRDYGDEVKDVHKRGEFMRIIGELSLELAEAQIRLSQQLREKEDLEGRIQELQEEIRELKTPSVKMVLEGNYYYKEDGDGPFCVGCYDDKRKIARVLKEMLGPVIIRKCSQCGAKMTGG